MTDLMPETNRRRRNQIEPGSSCSSQMHGPSEGGWNRGCRCPGAIAAHEAHLAERKRIRETGLATGVCGAAQHGSLTALRYHGCVCPEASQQARTADKRRKPQPGVKAAYLFRLAHKRWCGEQNKVSRFNLLLLLSGFVDSPTDAEYVAAISILERTGRASGTGLLDSDEIRVRLRLGKRDWQRLTDRRRKARRERHLRRLHAAKHRAQRA